MLNLIKLELFKLKRAKLLLMVTLGMFVVPGFMFLGLVFGNVGPITMAKFLDDICLYSLMLFNVIIYALLGGFLIVRDYRDHTVKTTLTTPISRNSYILGKFLTFEVLVILLTIMTFVLSVILATIGGVADNGINIVFEYFIKFLVGNILLSLVITPFIFISLIFKSIVPTVIGGVIASFSNSVVIAYSYGYLSPFLTPILLVTNQLTSNVFISLFIVVLTSLFGLILSLIYFSKVDVSL